MRPRSGLLPANPAAGFPPSVTRDLNIPAVLELLNLPLLFQRTRRSRPESKCRSTASLSLPSSRSWDLGWPLDSRPLWPPRNKG